MVTWKRLISLALCLALCLIALPGKAGATTQLTEEEFANKIAYLRTVYKHGEYWSRNNTSRTDSNVDHTGSNPCNGDGSQYNSSTKQWGTCGSFVYNGKWLAGQCYGYALKLAYEIFGSNYKLDTSSWEQKTSASEFYAGDHVRITSSSGGHSIFLTKVDGDTITYTDCNVPGSCVVHWDRTTTKSNLLSKLVFVDHLKGNTLKGIVSPIPIPDPDPDTAKLLNPMIFNKDYYRASRPELRSMSDSELEQHWIDHGINESPATPVFDVKWYKNAYAAELGQFSNKQAIIHFVDHGIHEGRASSEQFSINDYKDNYHDLKKAYGNNNYEYCIHYINYGRAEGRVANRRLRVYFNANGGACSVDSQPFTAGATYNTLPTPVRDGYSFLGWYTDSQTGTKITSESSSISNSDHTLYAHWTQTVVPVASVTLNKTALSLTAGDAETLTATVTPDNATNKAVTWTTSDASVATVSNGKVTAVGAGTATVTASADGKSATCAVTVTKPVSTYTVTYSANGGSGAMPARIVVGNETLTLPACAFTAPSGKRFRAWSTGDREYAAGTVFNVTSDTIFTAVWEDVPASDAMRVIVESKTAAAGQTVELAIQIENNPGIAMTQFKVAYDAALTLESVDAGNVFAPSEMMMGVVSSNPYTVMFFTSVADRTDDGTLAVLHFRMNDTAEENSVHTVSVSGIASNIDENEVETAYASGSITVRSVIYGDVNDDGAVNGLDVLRLGKFLTNWNVTINEAAADVNGDGQVNGLDQLRLAKYCAGWPVTLGS